jgi:hypothetical protein
VFGVGVECSLKSEVLGDEDGFGGGALGGGI